MRHLAILAALSLASCTAIQQRQACQQATGPEPDAYTHAFGMLGAVARAADPAWQDWNRDVEQCIQFRRQIAVEP